MRVSVLQIDFRSRWISCKVISGKCPYNRWEFILWNKVFVRDETSIPHPRSLREEVPRSDLHYYNFWTMASRRPGGIFAPAKGGHRRVSARNSICLKRMMRAGYVLQGGMYSREAVRMQFSEKEATFRARANEWHSSTFYEWFSEFISRSWGRVYFEVVIFNRTSHLVSKLSKFDDSPSNSGI